MIPSVPSQVMTMVMSVSPATAKDTSPAIAARGSAASSVSVMGAEAVQPVAIGRMATLAEITPAVWVVQPTTMSPSPADMMCGASANGASGRVAIVVWTTGVPVASNGAYTA